MMTALQRMILVVLIAALTGSLPAADRPKLTVLEIESFELTKAKVEQLKGAGGGKVVVFDDKQSKAECTVRLPSGWYEATLYVWAKDENSDCTFLWIEAEDYNAGVAEMPVVSWQRQRIAPCTPVQFRFEGAQRPRRIKLRPDETGVKLDRLEIRPM